MNHEYEFPSCNMVAVGQPQGFTVAQSLYAVQQSVTIPTPAEARRLAALLNNWANAVDGQVLYVTVEE